MNVDKLIEGAEKIINMVCKYVNQRTTEIEENVRQKLRERSDAEIKKAYLNKDNLNDRARKLVEEEARRRRLH